ncbi:MAG: hypothetical protein JRN58_07245 [Nitrososphaerota archaeon]|nr:hypothetical protein [Nitrososphaerota archaeon]MDG6967224.1 hypothetical protein [Nitrososphaerota archaeon]MDG6978859.1 hypothetical protein [Nitrososphaerota archaeon]
MPLSELKERQQRPRKRHIGSIVGGVLLIVLIVAALAYYDTRGVTSTTVDCFVGQYILVHAVTQVGQATSNMTLTMTTAISYTTTVNHASKVGATTANSTSTTNAQGDPTGVETVCKYISDTFSPSSTST